MLAYVVVGGRPNARRLENSGRCPPVQHQHQNGSRGSRHLSCLCVILLHLLNVLAVAFVHMRTADCPGWNKCLHLMEGLFKYDHYVHRISAYDHVHMHHDIIQLKVCEVGKLLQTPET